MIRSNSGRDSPQAGAPFTQSFLHPQVQFLPSIRQELPCEERV